MKTLPEMITHHFLSCSFGTWQIRPRFLDLIVYHLCHWILDFLKHRPQSVWIDDTTSSMFISTTFDPQGWNLDSLLYFLSTHDCAAKFGSNSKRHLRSGLHLKQWGDGIEEGDRVLCYMISRQQPFNVSTMMNSAWLQEMWCSTHRSQH